MCPNIVACFFKWCMKRMFSVKIKALFSKFVENAIFHPKIKNNLCQDMFIGVLTLCYHRIAVSTSFLTKAQTIFLEVLACVLSLPMGS